MRIFRCLCLLAGFLLLTAPAYADLVTFSSLSAFTAAAPGLPVETFESGLVAASSITNCAGPLSGATASACFPLGGLLPGVVYSSTPDSIMAILGGAGVVGNTSKVLGPALFASTMNLTFTSATAIGFDVFTGLAPGNILISVFSPTDAALGSFTIPGIAGGSFFGVVSTPDLIGRVNIASQAVSPGELIDNLRFGTTTTVPESSSLLLLAAGSVLLFRARK